MEHKQACWHVYLGNDKIETVFYDQDVGMDQIIRDLIDEGFDHRITIVQDYLNN